VVKNDDSSIFDGSRWSVMFRIWYVRVRRRVVEEPNVIVVSMRVKRNLLFCFRSLVKTEISFRVGKSSRSLKKGGVKTHVYFHLDRLKRENEGNLLECASVES